MWVKYNIFTHLCKNRSYIHGDIESLFWKVQKHLPFFSLYHTGFWTKFKSVLENSAKWSGILCNCYIRRDTWSHVNIGQPWMLPFSTSYYKFFFSKTITKHGSTCSYIIKDFWSSSTFCFYSGAKTLIVAPKLKSQFELTKRITLFS